MKRKCMKLRHNIISFNESNSTRHIREVSSLKLLIIRYSIILPGRKFVQVSRGDRYGHLYLELDVSTTFGHGDGVATIL